MSSRSITKGLYSSMPWEVEFTDEFENWWESLSADEQERVRSAVRLL